MLPGTLTLKQQSQAVQPLQRDRSRSYVANLLSQGRRSAPGGATVVRHALHGGPGAGATDRPGAGGVSALGAVSLYRARAAPLPAGATAARAGRPALTAGHAEHAAARAHDDGEGETSDARQGPL